MIISNRASTNQWKASLSIKNTDRCSPHHALLSDRRDVGHAAVEGVSVASGSVAGASAAGDAARAEELKFVAAVPVAQR